jgi:DNA-binding protein HU-beta
MNKGELIAALAAKTEMSKKDSEAVLNGLLDVIAETITKGEKVQLIGFGTFEAKSRPARVARNPRTGEAVKIPAGKAPAFKAGKALKDIVNK